MTGFPVVYQPNGAIIGQASTKRGAIRCAHNIPLLACETWGATLAERMIEPDSPEGEFRYVKSWFVSPHLKQTGRR